MKQVTVLGIGNILLQDEGFGVRVVEELHRRYCFPNDVQVLDGGTLGMELLRFVAGTSKLLVIDAIGGGQAPGTFYRFTGDEVNTYFQDKVSMHELGIKDVLMALELLDKRIDEVVIIGVEPQTLELGLELTATVAGKVDETVAAVIDQLELWQVTAIKSDPGAKGVERDVFGCTGKSN